jgi:hypothetical protein
LVRRFHHLHLLEHVLLLATNYLSLLLLNLWMPNLPSKYQIRHSTENAMVAPVLANDDALVVLLLDHIPALFVWELEFDTTVNQLHQIAVPLVMELVVDLAQLVMQQD